MRKLLLAPALIVALIVAPALVAQTYVKAGDGVRLWTVQRGKGSPIVVIHGGPGRDHLSL